MGGVRGALWRLYGRAAAVQAKGAASCAENARCADHANLAVRTGEETCKKTAWRSFALAKPNAVSLCSIQVDCFTCFEPFAEMLMPVDLERRRLLLAARPCEAGAWHHRFAEAPLDRWEVVDADIDAEMAGEAERDCQGLDVDP